MRSAAIHELERLAEKNDSIMVMTGDLGYGVFESFAEAFPGRFFNMGISEQLMTSAAAGMSLCGKTVVTYSIGNFATLRCIEQIRNDVCYHNTDVKIISVGGGFSYGPSGMSHHATEDISMMRSLPNMKVFVPADPEEAAFAVRYAMQTKGPCYIRLTKNGEPDLYRKTEPFDITQIQTVASGSRAALLACGPLLGEAIKASKIAQEQNASVGVYSVPCVKPLDIKMVRQLAEAYPLLVTIEEQQIIGGLGSAVAEIISEMVTPHARLCRFGLKDIYTDVVGSHDYLCEYYGLNARLMADAIFQQLEAK